MTLGRRLLATAGIVGPALFVAMWSILGATRAGYSPIDDAISRLAEVGSATRPAMTIGFLGYGVLVCAYAGHPALPKVSRVLVALTGLATLGVAAFPLGATSDTVHAVFAAIGYATLAGAALTGAGKRAPGTAPTSLARSLRSLTSAGKRAPGTAPTSLARSLRSLTSAGKRGGDRAWARWSIAAGTVCALCLAASVLGPAHGLFQRAGLTVGDAWLVASACRAWAREGAPPARDESSDKVADELT